MIWFQPGSKLHLSLTSNVETHKTDSTLPQVGFHQTRTESPTRFYLELHSCLDVFFGEKDFIMQLYSLPEPCGGKARV